MADQRNDPPVQRAPGPPHGRLPRMLKSPIFLIGVVLVFVGFSVSAIIARCASSGCF